MYNYDVPFFTVKETANFLRVHQSYIYHLLHLGILPGIKVGYFWRIPTPALEQFIISQLPNQTILH